MLKTELDHYLAHQLDAMQLLNYSPDHIWGNK